MAPWIARELTRVNHSGFVMTFDGERDRWMNGSSVCPIRITIALKGIGAVERQEPRRDTMVCLLDRASERWCKGGTTRQ